MTIEESKNLWKLEQEHLKPLEAHLSKDIKDLYKLVGEKIESGELLYETFAKDTMDLLTKVITTSKEDEDRNAIVTKLTAELTEKYKSGNFKPLDYEDDNGSK